MKTNKRFSFGRSVGKKELPTQPVRSTIKSCSTAQALYQGQGLLLPLLDSSGNRKGKPTRPSERTWKVWMCSLAKRPNRTWTSSRPLSLQSRDNPSFEFWLARMNRWLMPELPVVSCSLLKESAEVSLRELTQAAKEVSSKALGSRWSSREVCPSTLPAGANLQAACPELRRVQLDTPEGLIAGLGYALTRPGHTFQFHQANTAEERSGLAGIHQWSIMLPTSARVAQEVYEPLIGRSSLPAPHRPMVPLHCFGNRHSLHPCCQW